MVPTETQQRIVGALLHSLADKDTGVACDAAAALQQYGNSHEGRSCLCYHLACKNRELNMSLHLTCLYDPVHVDNL